MTKKPTSPNTAVELTYEKIRPLLANVQTALLSHASILSAQVMGKVNDPPSPYEATVLQAANEVRNFIDSPAALVVLFTSVSQSAGLRVSMIELVGIIHSFACKHLTVYEVSKNYIECLVACKLRPCEDDVFSVHLSLPQN